MVGCGIAGMTAAHILARRHEVTAFEASPRPGGHTRTLQVDEGGRTIDIDTGFIVFNRPNYPNLCRLFDALGIESHASDMSFSVHCEATRFEYNPSSIGRLLECRRNLASRRHWRLLLDILRFQRDATRQLDSGIDERVTVERYLAQAPYGAAFARFYFLPLGASLWSCTAERFERFPVRFVLEFLRQHGMLQLEARPTWRTVKGGASRYIPKLVASYRDRLEVAAPVAKVRRISRGVRVRLADGREDEFDEAVIAVHADQALGMVEAPDDDEVELLRCFPYQRNDVALHTDTGALPERSALWASWNYRIPKTRRDAVMVTYHMNRLQQLDAELDYCVTLNPNGLLRRERVIARLRYAHPMFTAGHASAQRAHRQLIRRRRLSYCGAYWGFGFHEDGVNSALAVAEAFDLGLGA